MSTLDVLRTRKPDIERVAARHGAGNIRVFGSTLRGTEGPESDVDLLIDVVGKTSSWFPSGLALDLQELLGRRVDILTERSLHPLLRERILHEARPL